LVGRNFFITTFAHSYKSLMDHRKGITFAIITAVLWGLLAIGIKMVLTEVDPITVVWVRMSIAALGLGAYFLMKRPSAFKVFAKRPKLIWVAAVGLALNYIGYAKGIDWAGPASAQVVIQLGPITLGIAGVFLFKEKFASRQIGGFIVAFVGLFFFYRQQLGSMDAEQGLFIKGVLVTIGGAAAWATYSITQKKLVTQHPVQQINLFLYTFSTIAYLPFVNFSDFVGLSPWMWLLLIFLGLNTLIAYGLLGEALKYTDAGKVSVIIILNPIITFAILAIMEALGVSFMVIEKIPFWAYVGAVMMLSGAALAVVAPKKKKA
jgi:drug/metabolite transporter (DMT)-like permease